MSARFVDITDCSIHHFADASQKGYGQVSYLRLVNEYRTVHWDQATKFLLQFHD